MPRIVDSPRTRRVVMGTLMGRIAIVMVVFTIVVYSGIYFRTRDLQMQAIEDQARTYTELIVTSRAWNARYGGVYVEKSAGVTSNPYLDDLGVDPDVVCGDKVFTLRNPALMTTEISNLIERDSGVVFHLTSLDPTNPDNEADPWEASHLPSFETSDIREVGEVVDADGSNPMYRYMIPLVVEDSCVDCHGVQRYATGEIRGGISVSIPIDHVQAELRLNAIGLGALALLTLFGVIGTVFGLSTRVVSRLEDAEQQLEHLATTDALTDLWNRRYMMRRLKAEFDRSKRQGHDLGLVMLDLDLFKNVNDEYGHAVGDQVLQAAAARMHGAIRDYDVLGRFGGEEFLLIAPETDRAGVHKLAERVRASVGSCPVEGPGDIEIVCSASAGAAMLTEQDLSADALLARSDAALYAAKRLGRDRTVVGDSPEARGLV